MSQADRERRHRANLEQIDHAWLVVGKGDRLRIDHEGTLIERARMMMEELSAHRATERGLTALDHLLRVAEERESRQTRDVVEFVAAVWNHTPLPLSTLRAQEQDIGDDMLAVLDAFRYARLNLAEHVDGGAERVARVLEKWSLAKA